MSIAAKLTTIAENEQIIADKVNTLKTDITNINNAFAEKGVEVGETPSAEYGGLLDDVVDQYFLEFTKGRTNMDRICSEMPFEKTPLINSSKAKTCQSGFRAMPNCIEIRKLDTSLMTDIRYLCNASTKLKTIAEPLDFSNVTLANSPFGGCNNLEYIRFVENSIPVSLDFRACEKLTVESLMSIINGLADLTSGTSRTLYIGSANISKLSTEQLQIAYDKNWLIE